ncbi:MAG: hypothetical protein ABEL04_12180 [Salinibacter sp.]|uniref:hypothetical protein n=1 Tax=Salinibacter sp. TaxID=2065818 RepID=UPI0035D48DA7
MHSHLRTVLFSLLVIVAGPVSALGQNNRYTERSFIPSPSVRAMGDAGVALLGKDRPFFYNPAQLPSISSYFSILGVQAAASPNIRKQINFYNRRVQPAIESNFDLEPDALEELYQDTYELGRQPLRGTGAVVLPSFVYSKNGIGVGGGLFAKTALNYRTKGAGLGVPSIYLLSRTDVMALLSLGVDLKTIGLPGVSVGVTGTRTRRLLAFENKPLDTFSADEAAILLQGNTYQVDVGGLYTPSWWMLPGTLTLGGAVYDLFGGQYDYSFEGSPRIPFLEGIVAESATVDTEAVRQEVERARRRFRLERSFRMGVAYRISSLSVLDGVGVAVDYQGYGHDQQHPLARLHLGGRARLNDTFTVRGGLSAGYPTGGLGIRLGVLRLDYAVHAFEEGRVPGQLRTYVHTARLTLRIE